MYTCKATAFSCHKIKQSGTYINGGKPSTYEWKGSLGSIGDLKMKGLQTAMKSSQNNENQIDIGGN